MNNNYLEHFNKDEFIKEMEVDGGVNALLRLLAILLWNTRRK